MLTKLNNNLFFKKFNYQILTQFNLISLLTHFSLEKYENLFTKIYLINKNLYLNNIINIQFTLNNYKIGLNIIYHSLLKGARGLILDSFEYKQFKRGKLSTKLNKFIVLHLQRRKNFYIHFFNYTKPGLFSNFRIIKRQHNKLKENLSLYSFTLNKFKKYKKNFYVTSDSLFIKKGLHFLPDIIIAPKIRYHNWFALTTEINFLKIPFIYLTDHLFFINKNYPIISSVNDLTYLFFEFILNKLILKNIIIKHYRFKIKSFKEKIKFKKKIFNIALKNKIKKIKNKNNNKIKNITFQIINKINSIQIFSCWKQIIKQFKKIKNKKKIFKRISITTLYKFLLMEKLFIYQKKTIFYFFYQILKKQWIKRKNWNRRKKRLKKIQLIYNNNATKSLWFKKKWWKSYNKKKIQKNKI